jgi:hypothetical protein
MFFIEVLDLYTSFITLCFAIHSPLTMAAHMRAVGKMPRVQSNFQILILIQTLKTVLVLLQLCSSIVESQGQRQLRVNVL